jgi:ankyrin repeat protein
LRSPDVERKISLFRPAANGDVGTIADHTAAFLEAASVPRDADHSSGSLARAESILAAHPGVATASIYAAAVLGDDETVRRCIARDSASATRAGGPHGWDALTWLCFSRYLRLDPARSDGFVRAATALLDAGASANTGWSEQDHQPRPEWESAIYGAAGVAHHASLTKLLLDRGADPNDEETPYHSPESYDNAALTVLVESGRLSPDSLATMLLRKADWHDREGMRILLEHGAEPDRMTRWGVTALHQAIRRDNALESIELLLDFGADPRLETLRHGLSGVALAARRGRGDLLALFARRGIPIELHDVERLLAACATDDAAGVREIADGEPELVRDLLAQGGAPLAQFAGVGNTAGVRHLLGLGIAVDAPFDGGDPYFGIPDRSTALHVAAWRGWPETVRYLLSAGASVNVRDGNGRTPLALAVRACVDSYWAERCTAESVEALLSAGASAAGVAYPTGSAELDALLARHV